MEANVLRGWRRTFSGDGVVLSIPEGQIHLRPKVTPVRPIRQLAKTPPPGAKVDGPFPLVTFEGEYGALVNIVVGDEQHTSALIYGDTFYALIDGRTKVPDAHATFRMAVARLAREHTLGLGIDRFRPYFYMPPPDWQPVARATSTLWIAPDCARQHATIQVFHARPARASVGTLQYRRFFEQLSREYVEERGTEPQSARNHHNMIGQHTTQRATINGTQMIASTLTLSDGRMLYLLRLEAAASVHDKHLPVLLEMAASARPLPVARTDVDVLIDWFD